MLSLKHSLILPVSRSNRSLTDLPSEILDLILRYVYYDGGGHLPTIFPFSRTCRHLRESTYPLILEKLTITASEDVIEKRSWLFLEYLLTHQHQLKHFRCMEIKAALEVKRLPDQLDIQSAKIGRSVSRRKLLQCINLMTGLRILRLHYISDMTLDVLEALKDATSLRVSMSISRPDTPLDISQSERLRYILESSPGWSYGLSLTSPRVGQRPNGLADLVVAGKVIALDWCDNWDVLETLSRRSHSFSFLEELHVTCKWGGAQDRLPRPGLIPWSTLKRLHVSGANEIRTLFTSVIDQLTNLEDLQLHTLDPTAFHPNCQPNYEAASPLSFTALPYTKLPSLRRLTLCGICTHIHVRHLTTPTLESLSLILPEYPARINGLIETRSPTELRWLAANVPQLTHLELQTGPLENLWNPTAIPGIDVSVEVYACLDAITQLPHLTTLRLFPPYVPRSSSHDYLNARQPLSDEQAITVFQYLHHKQPGLRTLSIAATFYTLRSFSPMSWLVRDRGDSKTLLTTRQAGKDYELEQAWGGVRRNTMSNRRHAYRKPYLSDLVGGWVFPVEDPVV